MRTTNGDTVCPSVPEVRQGRWDSHDLLLNLNPSSAEDQMLQHKGLLLKLAGRSPRPTCLPPQHTSSGHMDEESFPKTGPFQQLCTALQRQRAVGVNTWLCYRAGCPVPWRATRAGAGSAQYDCAHVSGGKADPDLATPLLGIHGGFTWHRRRWSRAGASCQGG